MIAPRYLDTGQIRARKAGAISESDLQDAIAELAHALGYSVAHFRPARVGDHWRTPVQYDGAGFPDLVLVGHGVWFVEVKSERGQLSSPQTAWLMRLEGAGAQVRVWRPAQWLDGTIERELRGQRPPRKLCPPALARDGWWWWE